jgi:magnesium transporter
MFKNDVLRSYDARDLRALRHLFKTHEIADIAEVLGGSKIKDSIVMFRLIPRTKRTHVFAYLPFERQELLLEELPVEVVASLLNQMQPDDRTKLLEDLPVDVRQDLINSLEPEERKIAQRLLSYPEESVGMMMRQLCPII